MTAATTSAPPQDDFIPAPDAEATNASEPAAGGSASETGSLGNAADMTPIELDSGLGQTEIILSLLAVIALAALLFILKGVIRKSLIAGRATMDTANAAAWAWYLSLLLFGALIIVGIAGDLFGSLPYIIFTVVALTAGVAVSLMMTSRARRSA